MLIKFRCQHCQTILEAGSKLAGQKGSCPKCGKSVTVPRSDSEVQTEPKESAKKGWVKLIILLKSLIFSPSFCKV